MARLGLLPLLALPISVMIGEGPAVARDSSLCARSDSQVLASGTAGEHCPGFTEQADQVSAGQPVLHDAAATIPVRAGPVIRAQHFVYRLSRPEMSSGETIVLLHGSGGDEASLFKLASRIAPGATYLGVRGRVVQKGVKRWYARLSPTEFDQSDIRKEARAFVEFLKARMAADKLDLGQTVFIGYSNGANLIAAVTLLYPDLIHRAVLLRAMPVLDTAPATDLQRSRFLTVAGKLDKIYAPFAPALESLLRDHGAIVDSRMVASGHLLGEEDVKVVSDWLRAGKAVAGGAPAQ
jgi:phospholipase/carboxylesterase